MGNCGKDKCYSAWDGIATHSAAPLNFLGKHHGEDEHFLPLEHYGKGESGGCSVATTGSFLLITFNKPHISPPVSGYFLPSQQLFQPHYCRWAVDIHIEIHTLAQTGNMEQMRK
jgi:hypothetical protein